MSESTPHVACELCGARVAAHESFVVQIDVFADPALPPIDGPADAALADAESMAELLEQMKQLSADELQDDVHRSFEYRLCPSCHREYLANPLGKPRRRRVGMN